MSEDPGFMGDKPQKKEKREYAPDFFGYLGKEMLANEALINAPGLTPLSHLDEPQMNADKRRCCCIGRKYEETENQKNLSCLSGPLSLRGEFYKRGVI